MREKTVTGEEDLLSEIRGGSVFEPRYLLQNNSAGYIGNSPVFWHASGSGYTQWIDEAKRWTIEEAQKQIDSTRGTHSWTLWTEEEIVTASKRTVDIQDLRRKASAEAKQ